MRRTAQEILSTLADLKSGTLDEEGYTGLMEDISDSVVDAAKELEDAAAKVAELEKKLEETNNSWQERYRARFFDGETTEETKETKETKETEETEETEETVEEKLEKLKESWR